MHLGEIGLLIFFLVLGICVIVLIVRKIDVRTRRRTHSRVNGKKRRWRTYSRRRDQFF